MAAIYSSTEVNVGILCSCLPTLKGGISYFFPRLFPDRSNRSGHEMRDVAPAPLSGPSKSFSGKEAQRSRQTWSPDVSLILVLTPVHTRPHITTFVIKRHLHSALSTSS